jgi:hypothetical protein
VFHAIHLRAFTVFVFDVRSERPDFISRMTSRMTSRLTRGQRNFALALIALATLWAWSPALGVIIADAIADFGGCAGDEGRVHPCVIAGHDFGEYIYHLTVSGWMMLVTWPFMLLSFPVWIVIIIRWWRARKMAVDVKPPAR